MFQKLTNLGPRFESPNAECNLIFLSGRFNVLRVVLAMAPAPTPVGRLEIMRKLNEFSPSLLFLEIGIGFRGQAVTVCLSSHPSRARIL